MSTQVEQSGAGSFRVFVVTAASVLSLVLLVTGMRNYRDLSGRRLREALLQSRIEEANERIRRLETTVELLESDPGMLERVAREELGMARPGDVVLKLSKPEPEAVQDPASADASDQ